MKKLIFLTFLIPFMTFARFHKGTVTMNDGSLKIGFIELPDYPDNAKLKFRIEENGDNQKLEIDAVKGFEVINDNGKTIRFITIYIAYQGNKLFVDKKKSWVSIVKEGKINLFKSFTRAEAGFRSAATGSSVPFSGSSATYTFYINKPGDKFAVYIDEGTGGNDESDFNYGEVCINCFKQMKKTIAKFLETDCPKLAELIVKEDIKKNGYVRIVELFEQNCGK